MTTATYRTSLEHYTLIVKSTERSRIRVSSKIIPIVSRETPEIAHPDLFIHGQSKEAVLQPEPLAFVNESLVSTRMPRATDDKRISFFVPSKFVPKLDYRIFSYAEYCDLKPYDEGRKRAEMGMMITAKPYRISFCPLVAAEFVSMDLIFLDNRLFKTPQVLVYNEPGVGSGSSSKVRARSIVPNLFHWQVEDAKKNKRYEISWEMPEPGESVRLIVNSGGGRVRDEFNVLNSFAVQSMLLEPGEVMKARARVEGILSSATKELVVVDPYLDESILSFMANVRGPLKVIFVGREMDKKPEVSKALYDFGKNRGVDVDVRGSQRTHDRFIAADKTRLFAIGGSFKSLTDRACLITEFQTGQEVTVELIRGIYQLCQLDWK